MACAVAPAQRISVLGLDFTMLRILILCGLVRAIARREQRGLRLQPLDWVFLGWVSIGFLIYLIRVGESKALIFQLGIAFDAVGTYFIGRCFLRTWSDVARLGRTAAVVALPTAVLFLIELQTAKNLFSMLGGVPEYTAARNGRLRCQGAFPHPILAGCFWASLLPLIAVHWWLPRTNRLLAAAGSLSVGLIVFATGSSTPVGALAAGILASLFYPVRFYLRWIRWAGVAALALLHFMMTMPVWHLVSRVDLVGGSTGRHRYKLLDEFIHRFSEWSLLGVNSTAHWGTGLFDVTNHFIGQGVRGGLLTLTLFLTLHVLSFARIGALLRSSRARTRRPQSLIAWVLGITLFVNTVALMGVQYLGQILVIWYLGFAAIASLGSVHRLASTTATPSLLPPGSTSPARAHTAECESPRVQAKTSAGR